MCFRLAPIPGAYKVLPPIEKPLSREDLDWSPGPSVSTSAASDSYLIQMERKQQFQPRTSYKVSVLGTLGFWWMLLTCSHHI